MISICFPSKPPFSFISPVAIVIPFQKLSPEPAYAPVMARGTPILIVSAVKAEVAVSKKIAEMITILLILPILLLLFSENTFVLNDSFLLIKLKN